MQQSLSNENFMSPFKMTHSIPYKSNYQQYATLPKQQYNKQLYQNYPNTKHNKQSLQPLSMISPQSNSNHITRELSPQNLKQKIKQIKTALRIAQEHNQQLHTKLASQKKASQQQIASYEKDLHRYKNLYEMLVDNLDKKANQLNETRKELQMKRVQMNELKRVIENDGALKTSNKLNSMQNLNSQHITMKHLPTRMQATLQHLTHENKLLRQQLLLKTKKLSEYDIIISTYQTQHKLHKSHSKTVSQLQVKISQLQIDNDKLSSERVRYRSRVQQVEIELEEMRNKLMAVENQLSRNRNEHEQLKLTNSQLQNELQSTQQMVNDYESGQQKGKWKHMFDQLSLKYNQLLQSNYQTQKEFEKQLHLINNEVQRRQVLKYSHR